MKPSAKILFPTKSAIESVESTNKREINNEYEREKEYEVDLKDNDTENSKNYKISLSDTNSEDNYRKSTLIFMTEGNDYEENENEKYEEKQVYNTELKEEFNEAMTDLKIRSYENINIKEDNTAEELEEKLKYTQIDDDKNIRISDVVQNNLGNYNIIKTKYTNEFCDDFSNAHRESLRESSESYDSDSNDNVYSNEAISIFFNNTGSTPMLKNKRVYLEEDEISLSSQTSA